MLAPSMVLSLSSIDSAWHSKPSLCCKLFVQMTSNSYWRNRMTKWGLDSLEIMLVTRVVSDKANNRQYTRARPLFSLVASSVYRWCSIIIYL